MVSKLALAFIFGSVCISFVSSAGRIKCNGKKPDPSPLLTNAKLLGCVKDISNEGKLCRCVAEAACGKNIKTATCITFFKSIVPKNYEAITEKEISSCEPQLKQLKSAKEDPEGKTCKDGIFKCVENLYNKKLCK